MRSCRERIWAGRRIVLLENGCGRRIRSQECRALQGGSQAMRCGENVKGFG